MRQKIATAIEHIEQALAIFDEGQELLEYRALDDPEPEDPDPLVEVITESPEASEAVHRHFLNRILVELKAARELYTDLTSERQHRRKFHDDETWHSSGLAVMSTIALAIHALENDDFGAEDNFGMTMFDVARVFRRYLLPELRRLLMLTGS